jgi:CubicO group peptidase (beta-lactamase class C family)
MPPLVQYPKIGIALCAMLLPSISVAQTISRDQVTAALPWLEEMINKVIRNGEVPGLSIAVVHGDEVVYLKGFGVREAGKPDTVGADTVFQIASLSKAISSTVVAALVSEGGTSWDAKIASLDPSFRLADPYPTSEVTIRDLFSHRSGLPGTAGDDLEDIGYDRAEILRRLRFVPASSSFRAGYSYSNFGLTEGAVAAVKPNGAGMGGRCRGEALSAARHDGDQLPPCRFSDPHRPRRTSHQGRRRVGRKTSA